VHSTAQNNAGPGSAPSSMASEARPISTLHASSNPNQTLKSLPAVIPKPTKPAPKKQVAGVPAPQPQSQPQLIGSVVTTARPISTPSPNSIQAAAFAAGGRIANPSTARSLLEAAKSKNVVHIRSGSVSLSSKPIIAAHTTINLSTIRASASSVQTSNPNQNLNSSPGSGTAQASLHPNQNLNSSLGSGVAQVSSHPNQNLNSSPGSGAAQALAHAKKVKSITTNAAKVEMEVTQVEGKKEAPKLNGDDKPTKDVPKLNGDDKPTISKEVLEGEGKNEVTGCLIGVEKTNGGVVSNNAKAVGVPETNKKENLTVVQTESKEKTSL
jgi:hypothetical protein